MKNVILFFFIIPLSLWSQSSFETAEKLFKEQKYAQAKLMFELISKDNPNDLKTLEYLGDIAGEQKLWDKALEYYKKIKKIKPSEANYYYKYGGALGMKAKEVNKFKALGMIGEIRSSFEKAISLDNSHIEARWALIELNLQLPAIVGGSQSKAIQYANELLQIAPLQGYLSRGYIDEYFNRYKEAETQYKKAFEIDKSGVAYQKLYELYTKKMKSPQKAKELKKL